MSFKNSKQQNEIVNLLNTMMQGQSTHLVTSVPAAPTHVQQSS